MPVQDAPDKAVMRRLEEMTRVKNRLFAAGLSLASIDRRFRLARGTAGTSLREPNEAGEAAIAAALGTEPHLLWPSRYDSEGNRYEPQPRENYERVPTMAERQAMQRGAAA
jgi:Ner family transcriptional regulator